MKNPVAKASRKVNRPAVHVDRKKAAKANPEVEDKFPCWPVRDEPGGSIPEGLDPAWLNEQWEE